MTTTLAGKVALITGAARGMGRAHAISHAAAGAAIVAIDLCAPLPPSIPYQSATKDDLDTTVRLIEEQGGKAVPIIADVRNIDSLHAAAQTAVDTFGRLDILVANAGVSAITPWDKVSAQDFKDMIDINLVGVWNSVMACAPHMRERGTGSIVLISSAAGLRVQPFMVPYVASKFAVTGLAKAFAVELAKDSIRVNSVHPTGTATAMAQSEATVAALTSAIESNPRPAPLLSNLLPLDLIEPGDVADAVLFLNSDAARRITGHAMTVDAGITLH